mgnify:CR=1 FL=1
MPPLITRLTLSGIKGRQGVGPCQGNAYRFREISDPARRASAWIGAFGQAIAGPGDRVGPPLDDVDFEVLPGEVHALLGGNGAGKSTILKVLNGVHKPDAGTIEVGGVPLTTHTPEAARAAGIAMNFQEMSLIPTLTVAQNIFLTREARTARGWLYLALVGQFPRNMLEPACRSVDNQKG